MSREGILSVKEKWALDAQLGELLRGLEPAQETPEKPQQKPLSLDEQFHERLALLISEFKLSTQDAVEIAYLLC